MGRPAACLAGDGTYLAFACGGEAGVRLCCPEDIVAAAGNEPLPIHLRHGAQQRPVTAMCFGQGQPPPPASARAHPPTTTTAPDATWLVRPLYPKP
jgi:hypothetical protein